MNTTEMSREEKYEYWTMVVEEFESSEKSIREQCRANNITYAQYYDWRKKIKQRNNATEETFIEVSKSDKCLPGSVGISIEYNDFRIHLPDNFSSMSLSRVLAVLRQS